MSMALLLVKLINLIDMKHTLRPAPGIYAVVRSDLKVSRDVVNVGHPGVLRYRRRLDYLPRPGIDDRDGEAGGYAAALVNGHLVPIVVLGGIKNHVAGVEMPSGLVTVHALKEPEQAIREVNYQAVLSLVGEGRSGSDTRNQLIMIIRPASNRGGITANPESFERGLYTAA